MARSYVEYPGDGSTTTFSIPFPYINKDHISISVNGIVASKVWLSGSLVLSPAPVVGDIVKIARNTPQDPLVNWASGGKLRPADLNLASTQALYAFQEMLDEMERTGGNGGGSSRLPYNVVLDYGADKTGSTNSAAAFQKAFNQIFLDGGGELVVPPGTYYFDNFSISDCNGRLLWDTVFNLNTCPCVRISGNTTIRTLGGPGSVKFVFRGSQNILTYQSDFAVQGGMLLSTYGSPAAFNAVRGDFLVTSVLRDPKLGCGIGLPNVASINVAGPLAVGDIVNLYRPGQFDPDPNPASHPGVPPVDVFRTCSREPSPFQVLTISSIDTVNNRIYFKEAFLHNYESVHQLTLHIDRRQATMRGVRFEGIKFITDLSTLSNRGTLAVSNGSVDVYGTGTQFTKYYSIGSLVYAGGQNRLVSNVISDTHLVVDAAFTVDRSGVKIPRSYTDLAMININQAFDISYKNCVFESVTVFHGTFSGLTIEDCIFDDCQIVGIESGAHVRVTRCDFFGRGDLNRFASGLYIHDNVKDCVVEQCTFHDIPTVAIWASHGTRAVIRDCLFSNCATYCGPPTDIGFNPNTIRYDALFVVGHIPVYLQALRDHMVPLSGTWATSVGTKNVVGTGTKFTKEMSVNGKLVLPLDPYHYNIDSITDDTHLTLNQNASATTSGNVSGCEAFLKRQTPEAEVIIENCRSYGPARTLFTAFNSLLTVRNCEFEIDNSAGPWEHTHTEGKDDTLVDVSATWTPWAPIQLGESGINTGDPTYFPNGHQGKWVFDKVNIKPYGGTPTALRSCGLISTNYGCSTPWKKRRAFLTAPITKSVGVAGPTTFTVDDLSKITGQDLLLFDDPTSNYLFNMAKGITSIDPVTKTITVVSALNGVGDSNAGYTIPAGTGVGSSLGDVDVWERISSDGLTWNGNRFGNLGGWTSRYTNIAALPAWAISTAYTAEKLVTNGGNVYRCLVGGTSSGVAGGPTGTTPYPITDGTVTWVYVAPAGGYAGVISFAVPESDGEWELEAVLSYNDGVRLVGTWRIGRSPAGATFDYADPIVLSDPVTQADGFYAWSAINRRLRAFCSAGTVNLTAFCGNSTLAQLSYRLKPLARSTFSPA